MDQLDFDRCYQAISVRDGSFEGSLFFGVKTTGVFCRPTCGARRPLRENVSFFSTAKEALTHGFRPCKRCHPLALPGATPQPIKELLCEIAAVPDRPIRDRDLRGRGLNPATVRRWFQSRHNMTFQAFQRMMRLNRSYQGLVEGCTVTEAAFEAGFESMSGFNERFRDVLGAAPSAASAEAPPILFERFASPLGPMMAGCYKNALCLLEFTDRRGLENELKDLKKKLMTVILPGSSPLFEETKTQLTAYFEGRLRDFDLPLFTPGTPFQQSVWQQLLTIPYGTTRTYKQQAEALENPKAVRAVARANGMNRIAIVIPCHRVIGADGSLTGYAGGLPRKRWLLDNEMEHF